MEGSGDGGRLPTAACVRPILERDRAIDVPRMAAFSLFATATPPGRPAASVCPNRGKKQPEKAGYPIKTAGFACQETAR